MKLLNIFTLSFIILESKPVSPKLETGAPVNGGRNYNGLKVAKFFVG